MATEQEQPKVEEKKVETPVEQPKAKVEAPKPVVDEDEEFINSLLEDVGSEKTVELTEEQQRQKNKDAEEARKRKAAEAKAKADAEAAKQAELQAKVTTTEQTQPEQQVKPQETTKPQQNNAENVNQLGQQLVEFKSKYPDIDLAQLDGDKAFKKFIDGKLLGKKHFTKLYEEYVELKAEITGTEAKVIQTKYQKANSSSGSSVSAASTSSEVFSEEELRKVAARLPTMNPKEAAKIEEKLKKTIAFYDSKK